jgi:hypothetical protein
MAHSKFGILVHNQFHLENLVGKGLIKECTLFGWLKKKGIIDNAPVYHSIKTVQDAHVLSSGGTKMTERKGSANHCTISYKCLIFWFKWDKSDNVWKQWWVNKRRKMGSLYMWCLYLICSCFILVSSQHVLMTAMFAFGDLSLFCHLDNHK